MLKRATVTKTRVDERVLPGPSFIVVFSRDVTRQIEFFLAFLRVFKLVLRVLRVGHFLSSARVFLRVVGRVVERALVFKTPTVKFNVKVGASSSTTPYIVDFGPCGRLDTVCPGKDKFGGVQSKRAFNSFKTSLSFMKRL